MAGGGDAPGGLTILHAPLHLASLVGLRCFLAVNPIAPLQPRMVGPSRAEEPIAEFHAGIRANVGLRGTPFVLHASSVGTTDSVDSGAAAGAPPTGLVRRACGEKGTNRW